jgi:hypothetical protein
MPNRQPRNKSFKADAPAYFASASRTKIQNKLEGFVLASLFGLVSCSSEARIGRPL